MKIRLANTAGFCMGVRRAVDLALDLQRSRPALPIVTYGPLIHNPQTLELLRSKGIEEVKNIDDITGGTVIIRAHGISPQEKEKLEAKGVKIIDATCPRVNRVQIVIMRAAAKGRFCVIVGDEDHPEVRGLMGYASAGGVAAPDPDAIPDAIPTQGDICVVAQTTQEPERFNRVVEKIRAINPNVHVSDTICDSTRRRQEEVGRMADEVDLVVVVGGKGSGNTQRLLNVAQAQGVAAVHVESQEELTPELFAHVRRVGVTAGASTPNWQIRRVIDKVKHIARSSDTGLRHSLRRVGDLTVMTYLWASAAGAGLTAACLALQGIAVTATPLLVSALFVFSMHILNRILEGSGAVRFNSPEIAQFYDRRRGVFKVLGLTSSVAALGLAWLIGPWSFVLLLGMLVMGRLYSSRLPEARFAGLPWRSLNDVPGSKTPLVALGWGTCASILPIINDPQLWTAAAGVSFLFAASAVFWRTALSDLLDIQGDRIVGRETIPILIGIKKTRTLLLWLLFGMCVLPALAAALGVTTVTGYYVAAVLPTFFCVYQMYTRRHLVDRLLWEGIMDGILIVAGLTSVL